MMNEKKQPRNDERSPDSVRQISLQYDVIGYASASVLFEMGQTKVLACITLQPTIPHFLKGLRIGWLTAEYAMLPCATHRRTNRESTQHKRNPRSVEISRLIGRCLRTSVDLSALPEKTIAVDCDVLQADGGTRVACITAASLALKLACQRWYESKITEKNIFKELIGAISAGIIDDHAYLDLSYEEDSQVDADFNFVISQSGKLIEVQGTAEKAAISWDDFERLKNLAIKGTADIFEMCSKITPPTQAPNFSKPSITFKNPMRHKAKNHHAPSKTRQAKPPLFSIGSRVE